MDYEFHDVTIDKGIATIAFNYPPLNISTSASIEELCRITTNVLEDESVRVIILTSAIPEHFGAGLDLNELLEVGKEDYRRQTDRVFAVVQNFIKSDKISIAAINGNAIGSAADVSLMCDIRIMGEPYYIRWPEIYLGLMPNWGGCTLLPMLVGRSVALNWLLSDRPVHTAELKQAGYLYAVVPPQEVLSAAQELADKLRGADQASVEAVKTTVLYSFYMPLDYAFMADSRISMELFGEPENVERAQAFLENRMEQLLQSKKE